MKIAGESAEGKPISVESDDVGAAINVFLTLVRTLDQEAEPLNADGVASRIGFQPPRIEEDVA